MDGTKADQKGGDGLSVRGAKSTDSNPHNPPPPLCHPFSGMTHDSKKEASGDRGRLQHLLELGEEGGVESGDRRKSC